MTTFFVLAGEASGDLHGALLLEALKALRPDARFVGMGGPRMAAAGLEVAKDLTGMQVVGFWEVAKHYGFFRQVFHALLDRVRQEHPAALICIDYPGFNLRFAREARKLGIPTLYYIVPQVWAWKPKRVARMAEVIERAYCVFEFEPPFFERFRTSKGSMKTVFVGHPLLDRRPIERLSLVRGEAGTIAFLSGSRLSEFLGHARPMVEGFLEATARLGNLHALLSVPAGVPHRELEPLRQRMGLASVEGAGFPGPLGQPAAVGLGGPGAESRAPGAPRLASGPLGGVEGLTAARTVWVGPAGAERCYRPMLEALANGGVSHASMLPAHADFSVVKSGTSTLEAGLQGNPFCAIYRGNWASYAIARMLVDIPVFSLVNIVLGQYVVPELLQGEVTADRIAEEIERGVTDVRYREAMQAALARLPARLGGPGASLRTAQAMLDFLAGRG